MNYVSYNPTVGRIPSLPLIGLAHVPKEVKERMFKENEYDKVWTDEAMDSTPVMKVMDLITKIAIAEMEILVEGKRPSHIYLGQSEKNALLTEKGTTYRQGDEKKTQKQKTSQLCGMELHFVEDETYFKIF